MEDECHADENGGHGGRGGRKRHGKNSRLAQRLRHIAEEINAEARKRAEQYNARNAAETREQALPPLGADAAKAVESENAAGSSFVSLGTYKDKSGAPQFYAVVIAATVVGMAIDFLGINPITALVVTAVINGLLAAPLLVVVMLVSNNRKVMGERTNGRRLNAVGWGTTAVMAIAAIALVVTTIAG